MPPRIMISHASTDEKIATAWYDLLRSIFPTSELRYSSDPRNPPFHGYTAFAEQIHDSVKETEYCLTVQTPSSRRRPWLIWEAGLAKSLNKEIFVVLYGVKPGRLENPLDSEPHDCGLEKSDVQRIVRTPTPVTKRHRLTPRRVLWKAIMAVAAAYHRSAKVKMVRRPYLSATQPHRRVPTNSPANIAAAKVAWSVRPNSP
jgi:hypothetical protein